MKGAALMENELQNRKLCILDCLKNANQILTDVKKLKNDMENAKGNNRFKISMNLWADELTIVQKAMETTINHLNDEALEANIEGQAKVI